MPARTLTPKMAAQQHFVQHDSTRFGGRHVSAPTGGPVPRNHCPGRRHALHSPLLKACPAFWKFCPSPPSLSHWAGQVGRFRLIVVVIVFRFPIRWPLSRQSESDLDHLVVDRLSHLRLWGDVFAAIRRHIPWASARVRCLVWTRAGDGHS